jgi:DNA-binding NarL/FixJ family response regulator
MVEAAEGSRKASRPWRVVLVDDSDAVRVLLRALLEIEGGFEVVGETDTGNGVLSLVDGLQVLTDLAASEHDVCTVLYTGFRSDELDRRARELGAADVLVKGMPPDEIVARFRRALARC